ncbi:MAG: hypothetical protein IJV13_02130 [Prevotella sp.]|nr:hypothetical protein [Prevotella sp.]
MEHAFTQKHIDPEMVINGKVRESRDSQEHPNSFPIIIALDTTGSMGHIPMDLIKGSFPEIMKSIIDAGIPDPQVCFVGVGDCYFDDAPVQCGQFESSDELMEKWFQKVYLEGGGGNNPGESYNLAWYFASRHTVTDSWEKRHKKGVLITIGDEPCLAEIPQSNITGLFGDGAQSGILSSTLIEEASEQWELYHIHMGDHLMYNSIISRWRGLLGKDRVVVLPRKNYNLVPVISSIIMNVYNGSSNAIAEVPSETTATPMNEQKITL